MDHTGIIPLFKPAGFTSHDCVMKLRGILRTKKVGHTGTLDPEVTGVLPICIGRATKIAEYMNEYPKTYIGEVTLGIATTTEDAGGEVVEEKVVESSLTHEDIRKVIEQFKGPIKQVPPMYSAVKINGKKLYEYARKGQTVVRPERDVNIYELEILEELKIQNNVATFGFKVHCSKGTYVRTLAVDIGKALGYPAHMSNLQRTGAGPFTLEDCYTFEQLEEKVAQGNITDSLMPIETAIDHFPKMTVDDTVAEKIKNGSVLPLSMELGDERISIYNEEGECLAIYRKHPTKEGLMKPEKMLKI
ncbi:tRNA pseudouridine(55) synthase TruB [Bacillus alkalicellulosilyticus]|uniref:tRNA pseudouridine(55) synthase TruB n=1 Tax=Alkalihalobacterium alkalicellulosilyticum TaxID=1912214 RepID=UPI000996D51D|nr:tRNA pseudouridine(55) synthase TruB [Bacillus alkalicellulosilyticus]